MRACPSIAHVAMSRYCAHSTTKAHYRWAPTCYPSILVSSSRGFNDEWLYPFKIGISYLYVSLCGGVDGPCRAFFPGTNRRGDNADTGHTFKHFLCPDDDL